MHTLLANPVSRWLLALTRRIRPAIANRGRHLRLGSQTVVVNAHFGRRVTLGSRVTLDQVTIGDYSYVANETTITHATIGKFCSIGPRVSIGLGRHPVEANVSTHPIFYSNRRQAQEVWVEQPTFVEYVTTTIGHDVWIGANAVLRDGITIGHGAVIGAGAVVTKDVPPYAIVGGVPATIIRYRFPETTIASLLELAWWDNDVRWIREHVRQFADVKHLLSLPRA